MEQRAVTVHADGAVLAGTAVIPEQPRGIAVLISGSGPIDRNSDAKRLALHVMGLLATTLAEAGWASLRYDKRGVGASGGDYWTAGLHDGIADARRAAAHARTLVEGPVVVIGHSEGAVIAVDLASDLGLVDGAVLLAGMAGTGEQTLRYQARVLEPQVPSVVRAIMRLLGTSVAKQQDKQLARLAASTRDTYRVQLVARINAKWFREFLVHDAGAALAAARVPMLAITGGKDTQVDPGDLAVMARIAGERMTAELVPDVDHILRHEPKPVSSPRGYRKQAGKPLDPRVTDLVVGWLSSLDQR